ncbi:hypothetical protein AV530_005806 [Patagioenas fasciata monilis]|uniref:Uncharacterized protein n=1 Tax=Patagioenas fasciata monilis TaxID=372326 RepID=A0A1V4JMS8_PATFA|nr:hypothetical protein AV530_005806 [Patagioenas fasciata monilis]
MVITVGGPSEDSQLKSKPPEPVTAVDVSSPAADIRRTARGPSVGSPDVRNQKWVLCTLKKWTEEPQIGCLLE